MSDCPHGIDMAAGTKTRTMAMECRECVEDLRAQIAALGEERDDAESALDIVSGALVDDAAVVVPENPMEYGDAVRVITKRAAYFEALAGRYEGLLREALPVVRAQKSLYHSMYPAWDLDERIDAALAKGGEGGVNP